MMHRRLFVGSLGLNLLAVALPGHAQVSGKVARIGFLGSSREGAAVSGLDKVFIAALRDLGWSEGRNLAFEYRWVEQRNDRAQELAGELVGLGVDLIVVALGTGVTVALAAKRATALTPILFIGAADPVKFGLVASFAHPGGNVTGLMQPLAHWGKWLELAHEALPGASRIAVIGNSTNVVYADYAQQNEAAAKQLGLQLQMVPVARVEDFAPAFDAIKRARADALVVGPDGLLSANLRELVERARVAALPVIGSIGPAAALGAVVSWSVDAVSMLRQAAIYADKILRGTRPADLPVQQPTGFVLAVNLKAAAALGLTIPPSLRLRADEVIE